MFSGFKKSTEKQEPGAKMREWYTTLDVARECGVSRWLVTRYLRIEFPRDERFYWRFDAEQYDSICRALKQAKAECPRQPLHAIWRRYREHGHLSIPMDKREKSTRSALYLSKS